MASQVQRWPTPQEFHHAAGDFLAAHEAEHCLLIGLTSTMLNQPDVYADPRFWTVHEAGRVVGAALRTPPHHLILSLIEPGPLDALTRDVLDSDDIPGVRGPRAAAHAVAAAWSARTGRPIGALSQERIFRLERVVPPRPAAGHCRLGGEADRALLEAWWLAFHREALPGAVHSDIATSVERVLRRQGAYLWDDGGEVVSLAAVGGPTPHGIRIGPVYTPPERRGLGYASNLVAEASQRQLDGGRRFCFLFTDLANPISNRIYQAIGYQPVVDVDQYRFGA